MLECCIKYKASVSKAQNAREITVEREIIVVLLLGAEKQQKLSSFIIICSFRITIFRSLRPPLVLYLANISDRLGALSVAFTSL